MRNNREKIGFLYSLRNACRGIAYTWETQGHFRFHCAAALVVVLFACFFKLTLIEWLILIYAIGAVLFAEIMNTAVEVTVDLAEPDFHPLAGIAKDVAAGAVVIAVIQAIIIGMIIFGPLMWKLILGK